MSVRRSKQRWGVVVMRGLGWLFLVAMLVAVYWGSWLLVLP